MRCLITLLIGSLIALLGAAYAPSLAWAEIDERVERANFQSRAVALAETIVRRGFDRFRRGWAVGPYITVAGVRDGDDGDYDTAFGGGLAVYHFDVPLVPSVSEIVDLLAGRAQDALMRRILARERSGERVSMASAAALADQVWSELVTAFLSERQPKLLEKPAYALRGELVRYPDADVWSISSSPGLGIGPIFFWLGAAIEVQNGFRVRVRPEISLPLVLGRELRTPVLEFTLGADLAPRERDQRGDRYLLGLRAALDLL